LVGNLKETTRRDIGYTTKHPLLHTFLFFTYSSEAYLYSSLIIIAKFKYANHRLSSGLLMMISVRNVNAITWNNLNYERKS